MKNMVAIGGDGMFTKKLGEEPIITVFIKSLIRILQIAKQELGDMDSYV